MISPVQAWVGEITGLGAHLTAKTLHAWQMNQVRKTLSYARNNGAFYKKRLAGIDAEKIISLGDMEQIPFTYPEEIIQDPFAFTCVPQRDISRITSLATSGSTGVPKRIFFTENDLERTMDFFALGMTTMVHKGQSVLIMMSSTRENSIADLLQKGLERIGVSSVIHGHVHDVSLALSAARGFDCLVGMPGEILYLCRVDASLRPRSVLLSADYVPESVIRAIKDTWHCMVFTHYGMTETGFGGGVQCTAGLGYHLRDADLLIEIIDSKTGAQLPPGEVGEVVLTTLRNEAMPLIRYRIGDVARWVRDPCLCGGILPRLDKIQGRKDNTLFLDCGTSISIHQLDEIMYAFPGLRNYRAKLVERKKLLLTVDSTHDLPEELLAHHLPGSIELEINYDQVPPFVGKRRIILD
ncbi:MAG: DVU_1553 family AMP-dependent CoA ligase [Dehalobacterium sp.]